MLDHQKHPHRHFDYYTYLPLAFCLATPFLFLLLSLIVSSNSPQVSSL